MRQVLEERRQRRESANAQRPVKPSAPLAASEVEFWLRQFSDEPRADRPDASTGASEPIASDGIFPPGYAEDMEE